MDPLIKYSPAGRLFRLIYDHKQLFQFLCRADHVMYGHDMVLDAKTESLMRSVVYSVSEFNNYMHLPKIRFSDRKFERLLAWYFYRLRKNEIRVAVRLSYCWMDDDHDKDHVELLHVVFVPHSHPIIISDCYDGSTAHILFPIITV